MSNNNDRTNYAIKQFEKNNIEYYLKNKETGLFHCFRKCDDELFQFYANTGTIVNSKVKGIHNLITLLILDFNNNKEDN